MIMANLSVLFCFSLGCINIMQVEQSASTSREKKEEAQKELDNETRVSALKKQHKLKMMNLKAVHTKERNRLKSALRKWENGVSHIMTSSLLEFLNDGYILFQCFFLCINIQTLIA